MQNILLLATVILSQFNEDQIAFLESRGVSHVTHLHLDPPLEPQGKNILRVITEGNKMTIERWDAENKILLQRYENPLWQVKHNGVTRILSDTDYKIFLLLGESRALAILKKYWIPSGIATLLLLRRLYIWSSRPPARKEIQPVQE